MAQEIQPISLGSIQGLHRFVRDVLDTLQLPALRYPGDHVIQESELKKIIPVVPLRLVKTDPDKFVCTGNIAFFLAAARIFNPETEVACVIETAPDEKVVRARIVAEIFVGRPILGFHQSDVPAYYVAFCKAIQSGLVAEPKKGAVSYIAELFGVDPRRLNSNPVTRDDSGVSSLALAGAPDQSGAVPETPNTDTEENAEAQTEDVSQPVAIKSEGVPDSLPPQKITLAELQKKTRKRPISGVTVDHNGRSIGLFVPLAAETTRAQVDAYRERVRETEENLMCFGNAFPNEILGGVPLELFDVQ